MACKRLRMDMRIVRSTDFPSPRFNWVGAFHIDRTAHWPYISHRVMGARLLA
jgi:hypothetical protein